MGFLDSATDFLFGSEKTAETKKTPRLTQSQMDLLKQLSGQVAGQVGEGVEPYPGEMAAGESELQQGLFDILNKQVGGQGGTLEQILQSGAQMAQQEYDPQEARDYWQQAFVEPTRKNFFEETMPQLREQFAGQGALSSGGFNRAVADAAADMNTQLGAQLAKAVQQGEQQNIQERQLGLSTLDQALNEVNALMQAGQQQRGIEQQGLEAQMQKWQQSQPYNNPWLQQAPTALGVSPYQIDTYTKGGGTGVVGGMLQGAAQGAGQAAGAAMMASDERLKKNISYTGDHLSGIPVVTFRWKNDPHHETHIGVLAQDVQKIRPDVVLEGEDGYLRVNYGQLLEEAGHGNH